MERMTPDEFRDLGYLQELNRRFLHPLGLALEVVIEDDGTARFGDIWDCRDDPEGLVFGDPDAEKSHRVAREIAGRWRRRTDALGFWVQPVGRS